MLAVPGEITNALSAGTNALLKLGATPVTSAEDVLELFDLVSAKAEPPSVGDTAQSILDRLGEGALTADEVVQRTGIDAASAGAALIELELVRRIALEDGVYRLSV